jgi:glycosyltransferase involved in cell wall biosynthesis
MKRLGERKRRLLRNLRRKTRMVGFTALLAKLKYVERYSAPAAQNENSGNHSKGGRRSVMFLNNSYYNFYYLAAALRGRGWDALSVSFEDPKGPNANFYHGVDLCLYDPDPIEMFSKLRTLLFEIERNYKMVHFYGKEHVSLFPPIFHTNIFFDRPPFDILRLKRSGIKIGYSVCGCLDGAAQSTVHAWSGGCCDRCVWQQNSAVCNDRGNLAWGRKVHALCDLIATEGFPALDFQAGKKVYREPLTTALDPDFWRPDLEIPERFRLARQAGEFIVYHGVGNFDVRAHNGRNLKGTPAIVAAIERLRSEGVNVRLEFATGLPNTEVRFLQAQADVIVDQLNHGRYGATAREGMMLGRPTVCYINKNEPVGEVNLESIETCPLVSADESSIHAVLRELLGNAEKRKEISHNSREFALKWHSANACAARFEEAYDSLFKAASREYSGQSR